MGKIFTSFVDVKKTEFSKIDNHPYIEIKTIRDIPKDAEIYLNYGPGFSKMFLQNEKLRAFYQKSLNK